MLICARLEDIVSMSRWSSLGNGRFGCLGTTGLIRDTPLLRCIHIATSPLQSLNPMLAAAYHYPQDTPGYESASSSARRVSAPHGGLGPP